MAQKRQITILLAVLTFLNGISLVRTNPWWGLAFLLLAILLSAQYFSRSFREFIERNRTPLMTLLLFSFGILGIHYYTVGNIVFALIFAAFMLFVGFLIVVDIWAVRTFPDLKR